MANGVPTYAFDFTKLEVEVLLSALDSMRGEAENGSADVGWGKLERSLLARLEQSYSLMID